MDARQPVWLNLAILAPRQACLLALLKATCACLEQAGVPCWITGGTLIGALRHGGFIPHDDDIDLECFESDAARIEAAVGAQPSLVFRKGGLWNTTQVVHVGIRDADQELDIFLRESALEEHRDFPSASEIFPLSRCTFHGVEVPCPGKPSPYLQRLYGEDWATTVRVWSHDFNQFHGLAHDPNKVSLTVPEYEAQVATAGYRPPMTPPEDVEEALQALFAPGGPVQAARSARDAGWLESLRRRNREQAEASLRLEADKDALLGDKDTPKLPDPDEKA